MAWRASSDELKGAKGPERKEQMLGRIDRKVPVGLIGYLDGVPTAWVSVAPRDTFRGLGGPQAQAGEKIYSLTCMFVPRTLRGQGFGHELIQAAIAYARKRGATVLEAYPVDPESPSYRHMGFLAAFETAGFTEVGREGSRRHVVRLTLPQSSAPES